MALPRHATPPSHVESELLAPGAPRHGTMFDDNGPLSPRRSRRTTRNPYSSHRNVATTPEPSSHPSPPISPVEAHTRRSPALSKHRQVRGGTGRLQHQHGLQTPAKTPKPVTPPSTGSRRKLNFQLADPSHAMPTPRKLKSHACTEDLELYQGGRGVDREVVVYSDWNARVPTRDESADNPFNGLPTPSSRLRERHRKASPKPLTANMSNEEMRERVDNDEGLIFTFRGKQVYRPYEDMPHNTDATLMGYKPIRRSSNRPRRLTFGVEPPSNNVDEEATTDIEIEEYLHDNVIPSGSQPKVSAAQVSLFDGWARTRTNSSRKREAGGGHGAGPSKRLRSGL